MAQKNAPYLKGNKMEQKIYKSLEEIEYDIAHNKISAPILISRKAFLKIQDTTLVTFEKINNPPTKILGVPFNYTD